MFSEGRQSRPPLPLGLLCRSPGSAPRGRCCLIGHLLHELAHSRNMTRRPAFAPGLEALRRFFHMREYVLIDELLANLRDDGLDALPNPEKLAARLKEEVFVEKTVVEQRAGLVAVTEHHSRERPGFRSGRSDAHDIFECAHDVVLEEPVPCLAQPRLASHLIDLQVKLCLFV